MKKIKNINILTNIALYGIMQYGKFRMIGRRILNNYIVKYQIIDGIFKTKNENLALVLLFSLAISLLVVVTLVFVAFKRKKNTPSVLLPFGFTFVSMYIIISLTLSLCEIKAIKVINKNTRNTYIFKTIETFEDFKIKADARELKTRDAVMDKNLDFIIDGLEKEESNNTR